MSVDTDKGIIEATDTTMWFGFKDDIVIRINDNGSEDNGSEHLVDIRSKSRVGSRDLGKNAERIHDFIDELKSILAK
ncbi:DUF1499 domain-containing protein [Psychrobacter arcticus]|uniref:DUF1499 domain-containing protein n=1 Tax=Psychrobacter arcticus TaxID=334543 RepID=UPI0022278D1F|nr:DUF1499 domain-containing protein [Psychrobacter arcticus]